MKQLFLSESKGITKSAAAKDYIIPNTEWLVIIPNTGWLMPSSNKLIHRLLKDGLLRLTELILNQEVL